MYACIYICVQMCICIHACVYLCVCRYMYNKSSQLHTLRITFAPYCSLSQMLLSPSTQPSSQLTTRRNLSA